jgi:hypothetical protein
MCIMCFSIILKYIINNLAIIDKPYIKSVPITDLKQWLQRQLLKLKSMMSMEQSMFGQ